MKLKSIILSLVAIALLGSCSISNDVVGGGIQKRKYNDGFYFASGKKYNRKIDAQKVETIFVDEEIVESEKIKIGTEELASKYEEVIIVTEVSAEPQLEEITDLEKIETKNNAVSKSEESEIQENESVKTNDKIGGIYKSKNIKTIVSHSSAAAESGLMLVLLVILCFILPPLAVFLVQDTSSMFWIDLILWLLGWGVGYWLLGGLGGLCTLVAVIVALLVVFGVI